jgi:hypothetical protein
MDIRILVERLSNTRDGAERERIEKEISMQFSTLSESEKEAVRVEFLKSFDEKIEETKIFLEEVDLKIEMLEISKFISLSQIAKTYFGKTRTWLYQRLYGYKVNGKPAQFTPTERQTLANALKDIAQMAQNTSLKIA